MDRSQQLADLLVELAPTLRARIRARRGARPRSISTSEIYATVVRRTLDLEAREGVRAVGDDAEHAGQSDERGDPRSRPPEDARQSPRLWALLHTLIDRVIGRADRTARRARTAMPAVARGADGAAASDPADLAEREELRRSVVAIVDSLDESDREIVSLRLQDLEWASIAARTGHSAAACRQRWHRLIERLAKAVSAEAAGDDGQAPPR
ncbi:MAG: hypothetical protein GC172_06550 [Phycisphaera sp.]|nr:hypothetical protein [Phycisphaera sp.]